MSIPSKYTIHDGNYWSSRIILFCSWKIFYRKIRYQLWMQACLVRVVSTWNSQKSVFIWRTHTVKNDTIWSFFRILLKVSQYHLLPTAKTNDYFTIHLPEPTAPHRLLRCLVRCSFLTAALLRARWHDEIANRRSTYLALIHASRT